MMGREYSLKMKMTIQFSAVFISFLFVLGWLVYQMTVQVVQNTATQYMEQAINQANDNVDRILYTAQNNSATVFGSMLMQQLLNEAASGDFLPLSDRQSIEQTIYDTAGQDPYVIAAQVYSTKYGYYGINDTPLQMADIKNIVMNHKNLVQRLTERLTWLDPITFNGQTYLFGVSKVPNFINNNGLGYYMTVLDGDMIQSDFSQMRVGTGARVFLVNRRGLPIFGTSSIGQEDKRFLRNLVASEFSSQEFTGSRVATFSGKRSLITYSRASSSDMTTLIVLPTSSLTSGVSYFREIFGVAMLIAVVVTFFTSRFLVSRLSRSIHHMQNVMKRVEDGDLNVQLPVSTTSEINQLSTSFNNMVRRLDALIKKIYESELRQREAELKALQTSINPHFLYNTLDSLYWMLTLKGQDDIAKTVVALSKIFRYSIGSSHETDIAPLKAEIEHVLYYLDIQRIRFEGLNVRCEVEPDVEHILIQKLLLQPLVENAIYHGLENKADTNRCLGISAARRDGTLVVIIDDNGIGIEPHELAHIKQRLSTAEGPPGEQTSVRSGIGIENVNLRIKLTYGPQYGLNIDSERNVGTVVTMCLPLTDPVLVGTSGLSINGGIF